MGYDVSFHPISPEEMREWYFTPLTWIQQGQEEKVLALAAQHGMEDFYAEKYLNTLRVGAETESNELFDKSHGFYIAVCFPLPAGLVRYQRFGFCSTPDAIILRPFAHTVQRLGVTGELLPDNCYPLVLLHGLTSPAAE